MFPDDLDAYQDRVAALIPAVLHDAFGAPTDDGRLRAYALAAAAGLLLRHADAVEACDEDGEPSRLAGGRALVPLRRATSLLPGPDEVAEQLVVLARAAQGMALGVPAAEVRAGLDRARDHGDPHAAADRLCLLEDADDALSVAVVLAALGRPVAGDVLRDASLRIGRHLIQGISEATRWRIEAAAERACRTRDLWTDPVGQALWMPIVEPGVVPRLLEGVPAVLRLAAAGPAADDRGAPGDVLLLLWDPSAGRGHLVPLEIRFDPTAAVWGPDDRWAPTAWAAVRAAYIAAAARLVHGPPPGLEAHRVRILGDAQVDGESLGLAAALAFYSLWTGQGLPRWAAATGVVDPITGAVGPVVALGAKVAAWRGAIGASGGPLLVPDQGDVDVAATPCSSVAGALAACGLTPGFAAGAPDVVGRVAQLQRSVAAVELQDLSGLGQVAGGDPWALLGDRVYLLAQSLEGVDDLGVDLREARVQAALAWLHAGEVDQAWSVLGSLGEGPLPAPLALLRATVALNATIDGGATEGAGEDARITELLAATELAGARHRALGTQGRWRMHRREPCVALLEAAVEAAPGWDRGRSRVYLAMGLREAGLAAEALEALGAAEADLEAHTRPRSLSYWRSSRVYLRYEQARAGLALGRADEAARWAEEALAAAAPGFWPRAGILRVLAQAQRAAGRTAEADATVARLAELVAGVPEGHRALMGRIAAEARGERVEPPVVF